jgi:WD40 repeat protein
VRFNGDGSLLAIAGSPALVIDAGTGRSVASLPLAELRSILSARFAADQRSIIATIDSPAAGSTAIQRFDARTGRPIGRPRAVAPDGRSVTVLAGPGSNQVTTTHDGGPTVVRDAVTLRPLRRIRPGGEVAALSTDAHTMVTGGRDGAVRFVDIRTGTARTALGRHDGGVVRVALSRDGRTAVTAGADNRLLVWDVERGAVRETFQGAAQTTGLAISPDGRTLYAGGLDGKVTIWDLAGDRRLGRVFGAESYPRRTSGSDLPVSHALSADGRLLALGRRDGTVELVDPKTLRTLRRVPGVPHGAVSGLAFAPGSGLLAVAGGKGYLALIDHRDGSVVRPLAGHGDRQVLAPSFSTDGRRMLTVSLFDTVQLWTLRAGRPVGAPRRFPTPPGVVAAALSPDGRTVALTGSSGIVIADAVTMRRRATLRGSETVRRLVRFTADGRFIVGGSAKGWTRLWSARTYQPASPVLGGHSADVVAASTSPDGRVLATGGADGTVRLYDLRTYRMIGAPLPAVANRAVFPDFTSDGAYLFALTGAGRQYRWDVRLPTWVRQACAIAGRRLTPAEWREALPGREYRPACAARAGSAP